MLTLFYKALVKKKKNLSECCLQFSWPTLIHSRCRVGWIEERSTYFLSWDENSLSGKTKLERAYGYIFISTCGGRCDGNVMLKHSTISRSDTYKQLWINERFRRILAICMKLELFSRQGHRSRELNYFSMEI